MPKVGNYVQRDYHSRFSAKRKSTWKNYNDAWSKKRSGAIRQGQALRSQLNSTVTNITVATGQQQASMSIRNSYSPQATYASPTAVAQRVSVLA